MATVAAMNWIQRFATRGVLAVQAPGPVRMTRGSSGRCGCRSGTDARRIDAGEGGRVGAAIHPPPEPCPGALWIGSTCTQFLGIARDSSHLATRRWRSSEASRGGGSKLVRFASSTHQHPSGLTPHGGASSSSALLRPRSGLRASRPVAGLLLGHAENEPVNSGKTFPVHDVEVLG